VQLSPQAEPAECGKCTGDREHPEHPRPTLWQLAAEADERDDDHGAEEAAQQPGELGRTVPEDQRVPGAGDREGAHGQDEHAATDDQHVQVVRGAPLRVERGRDEHGEQVQADRGALVAALPPRAPRLMRPRLLDGRLRGPLRWNLGVLRAQPGRNGLVPLLLTVDTESIVAHVLPPLHTPGGSPSARWNLTSIAFHVVIAWYSAHSQPAARDGGR
jgi:hypothetical protein